MDNVYTVAQANKYIKNMFTQDFLLSHISVKGEVSNCKYHSMGHIYFSIKDAGGVLSCVMFQGKRKGLNFLLQDGQKVVVSGNINVYEKSGQYQLYADKIEKEGTGDLYKKFLELKQELEDMGMFSDEYKKPIPPYAMSVGIVTASTGAAIQDIINISKRRNPYVTLKLFPAKVQGEGAAQTIVKGIEYFNRNCVDVIIVGRGGGSIEDLWAFNEKIVARTIFESEVPIISAVGHETDFTIADYVADLRAPTPSAAAELAVFRFDEFINQLYGYESDITYKIKLKIKNYRRTIEENQWKLSKMSPKVVIQSQRQYLTDLNNKLTTIMQNKILLNRHELKLYAERLQGISPLGKLSGGFAFLSSMDDERITSINQMKVNQKIKLSLKDGVASAVIKSIDEKGRKYGADEET